jgi:hypothetical protein
MVDIWDAETGAIVPAGTEPDTKTFKFEDDMDKFRFPNASIPAPDGGLTFLYRFDRQSIFAPIAPLRCPWHTKKTGTSFDNQTRFIGFDWDLPLRRVRLPEFKRAKYHARVSAARLKARTGVQVSLHELEEIHGMLVHIAFIFEEGNSHLPAFSNLFAGYRDDPYVRRKYSSAAVCALDWWNARLADKSAYRQLRPLGPLQDLGLFVDASTSWGIGIVIGRLWYSFRLAPDWKTPGRDICWLEAIALELLIHFLGQLNFQDVHLRVYSDNKGAIGVLTKGRSPNNDLNLCARRTKRASLDHMIVTDIVYVDTSLNIADAPSRGESPYPLSDRLSRNFDLPYELEGIFIDGDW